MNPVTSPIDRYGRTLSLRGMLILTFVLLALLPMIGIGIYTDIATRKQIESDAQNDLAKKADQAALQIDSYMLQQMNNIRTEAQQPTLGDYLALAPSKRMGSPQEFEASRILLIFSGRDPEFINSYALLDSNGINVMDTDDRLIGQDESGFEYFESPFASGIPYLSTALFRNKNVFYLSAPVRDSREHIIGVLRAEYDLALVQFKLNSIIQSTDSSEFISLYDQNSLVRIADTGGSDYLYKSIRNLTPAEVSVLQAQSLLPPGESSSLTLPALDFVNGYANDSGDSFFEAYSDSINADALMTSTKLSTVPWVIIEGRSQADLTRPIVEFRTRLFLIVLLVLLFAVLLAVFFSKVIAQSIAGHSSMTGRIANGEFDTTEFTVSENEEGILARASNLLTEKLRRTLLRLEVELQERKNAEEVLRQSEERYRALIDSMQDGVYRSTHEGRFVDVNPAMVRLFGYESVEEMLALDIKKDLYFSPEDRESNFLDTDQERVEIFRMKRKDGSEIWVEDHGHYVRDEQGKVIFHEGLLRDITERVHAEKELRDSEEKFRKIFNASPVAICITTVVEGKLLEANYAYWDITGYDPETSIGRYALELEMWDDPGERMEFVQKLREKRSIYNEDDHFYHTDGSLKHVISFYELIRIGGQDCILTMFYDMSTQKQTLEALKQSELRVFNLLEAIPDMIVEVSLDGVIVNMIPPKTPQDSILPEQYIGKSLSDAFDEEMSSRAMFALERAIDSNQINVFEFENARGERTQVMEARVAVSTPSTAMMMIRDITQRKWIENERESIISELEQKNRESETLRESLASIVTTFELTEVLNRILDQIKLVIPYDTASVWRVEENFQKLLVRRDLPNEMTQNDLVFRIDEGNSSVPIFTGEKEYILSNNVQEELPDFRGPHSYINSWLAIPLKTRGNVIGVIALDGRSRNQFTDHHARLAITFANQVAIALENTSLVNNLQSELDQRRRLIDELKVMNAEAETMRESLSVISGTLEFTQIVEEILDQIQRVIPYDSASVWRVVGNREKMVGQRGLPPELSGMDMELPLDESNHSYPILRDKLPYVVSNDVQAELARFREPPHNYIQSWLCVPLKARGKIIGFIALDGKQKAQFNQRHIALAVTFSNQVAIALENADLFSSQQRELEERKSLIRELEAKNAEAETLRESTAIVAATLDISETVQRIFEQMKRVVQYDSGSVWLYQGNKASMMGSIGLPKGAGRVGGEYIVNENEPDYPFVSENIPYILLDDIQERYAIFREPPQNYIHGWLAIPLKARDKLIGFISLDSRQVGNFTEHDAQIALTFAEQVSIALENARLFSDLQTELEERRKLIAELETKNIESETLRESAAIVAATLEPAQTVRRILDQVKRVVPYDSASVWLYQNDVAVMLGANDLPPEALLPGYYELDDHQPDAGIRNEQAPYVMFDDIQENYPAFREPFLNYIHGWLAIPMRVRGKLTGFISLDSRQRGRFTDHDAHLALTFAEQVSIALENARLFSDLQRELDERRKLIAELETKNIESETLRESAAIVTATLDQKDAINQILEQLERVIPFDSASVQVLKDDLLEIVSAIGYPVSDRREDNIFPVGKDEPAYPIIMGEIPYVLFNDVQEHFPAFLEPPHDRIHAWMAVPLRVKGKTLGIIALDGYRPGMFSERHAYLALTYANQVAIALENARLFSDLEAELASRKELIAELESKNMELERFTYTVSHDLKSPLFTIRGFLGYLERDALAGNIERMRSDMQRISDATEKMHNLLNDLLELSRIGRLESERGNVPFESIAREAVELVQGRIMESGIAVHIDADMGVVYGEKLRLIEVMQNLADNAAKFMGDQQEPRIEIGQDGEQDGMPVFYVRDNGMGIPSEHYDRVFGLFNKLDVKGEGTGIGLALVKRIIEVHGGRIWVESEEGSGSTFFFTLPPAN